MAKIMLFIDGTWLYANNRRLSESYGDASYRVDFGKLPSVLAEEVSQYLGKADIDVVRTYLFASYAINYNPLDEDAVLRRKDFFDMLKEEYHYEVEVFPINYIGRRLRKTDRDPGDTFEPKEKCVDIALATNMLYYAAIPQAYDIAIAVVGDRDFMPMLQSVRRLGKRVAIASIKNSCAPEFADPHDDARVKDYDIIWLDDLLQKLELKWERHQLKCESPVHKGNPLVWTTFHPRKNQKFYCDICRQEISRQRYAGYQDYAPPPAEPGQENLPPMPSAPAVRIPGVIKKLFNDRGFGFISTEIGDYYFHLTDLVPGLDFSECMENLTVDFEVKRPPANGKAGAAQKVGRHNPELGMAYQPSEYPPDPYADEDQPMDAPGESYDAAPVEAGDEGEPAQPDPAPPAAPKDEDFFDDEEDGQLKYIK
ncbi:MAG: NYN domain-containing protein [Deltaproteobacteria bacterium]|nr:NYN domain-containing protein [Deltaproteobacteria bacterium]